MRINEDTRKTVVFIGVIPPKRDFVPFGTAFLCAWDYEGYASFPLLVTARHVLEDAKSTGHRIVLRITTKSGTVDYGDVDYDHWVFHPTIPKCDVAITPVNLPPETFDIMHVRLNPGVLTEEYIKKNDVGAGDEVFVTGLLARHFGTSKNIPVVRIGNIAAMPEEPVDMGTEGHHYVYLIESRSIGGLSGSPVFLNTPPFRIVDTAVQGCEGHEKDYLMGVNVGLFQTNPKGDKAPGERVAQREDFLELMSSGIAVVVPIQRVVEIIETDKVQGAMKRTIEKKQSESGFVKTSAARSMEALSEPEIDNPSHKEDFTYLLNAAARGTKPVS